MPPKLPNKMATNTNLKLQTIRQGSETLICILFTKLNIHLLLERVSLNFPGYSLTVTQLQSNATKRLHKFRKRSHFSRDEKRIYEKTYYSHASSVVSTATLFSITFDKYTHLQINLVFARDSPETQLNLSFVTFSGN
ncbi:hypothetical protein CSKR_105215 [Clonorchis sinensis]|uniref:Uncharacterized protein n=1 Tax=Clonorchis sinensis TaxID=79923 RepID=A0A419PD47_CLOSI|nr:hypothetical protein CSKR_105215 [Clonorchis sinensis]